MHYGPKSLCSLALVPYHRPWIKYIDPHDVKTHISDNFNAFQVEMRLTISWEEVRCTTFILAERVVTRRLGQSFTGEHPL